MSNKRRRTTVNLLGDFPCTVDELFLGVGVVLTALKRSCFTDQTSAAVAQLGHLLPDVRTDLKDKPVNR